MAIALAATVLSASCIRHSAKAGYKAFPQVYAPKMLYEPEDRMGYCVLHFWDNFVLPENNFSDSLSINGVALEELDRQMGVFASLVGKRSLEEGKTALVHLFDKIEEAEKRDSSSNVFEHLCALVEKYFYDASSPLRYEDVYSAFAAKFSQSACVTETERMRAAFEVEMCSLNACGSKANDFVFTDLGGDKGRLHSVKANFVLLLFSNHDCAACRESMELLCSDMEIEALLRGGWLKVLNVYVDKDLEGWRAAVSAYPKEWINAYAPLRDEVNLYNIRAIPSFYLLDGQKRVLLKDAPLEKIVKKLRLAVIED